MSSERRIAAQLTVELAPVPFGLRPAEGRCAHPRCTQPSSRPDREHV